MVPSLSRRNTVESSVPKYSNLVRLTISTRGLKSSKRGPLNLGNRKVKLDE